MTPDPQETRDPSDVHALETRDAATRAGPPRDETREVHQRETRDAPGARAAPPPGARPGRLLAGRYQIETLLGRGGMGVVLQARDLEAERPVAIKLLLASELSPERAERFRREGELAAAVNHPGIVRVHAAGLGEDGRPFLVYELIEGARTLNEAGGDLRTRVELVRQAAAALGEAHAAGIVHRDVKPENVLVDPQGRARVTDFGAALHGELERLTVSGAIVGTPLYMAPEQLRGDRGAIGPATDVWALGVILYEQVCGEPPFPAESLTDLFVKVDKGSFPPPSRVAPQTPPGLARVILRCLRPDPADRYPDGRALAGALERAFDPAPRRWPGVALAAGLALVAAALAWRATPASAPAPAPESASPPPATAAPSPSPPTPRPTPTPARLDRPRFALACPQPRAAAWALGGRRIAVIGQTRAQLWDPAAPRRPVWERAISSVPYALAVSPDGDLVAFGGANSIVWIVSARDGAPVLELRPQAMVNALAFSPDGARLAVGSEAKTLGIYDLAGTRLQALPTEGPVHALAWTPDGKRLLSGGRHIAGEHSSHVLRVWDLTSAPPREARKLFFPGKVHAVLVHPRRPRAYVGDSTGGLTELELDGEGSRPFISKTASSPLLVRAHLGRVLGLALGPRGARILSVTPGRADKPRSGEARGWSLADAGSRFAHTAEGGFWSAEISPDGQSVLLTRHHANQVEVWPAARFFPR